MGLYYARVIGTDADHVIKPVKISNNFSQIISDKNGRTYKFLKNKILQLIPEPDIGEMQIVASTQFDISEYFDVEDNVYKLKDNNKSFDGWVFADGKTYCKSDFPKAYEVYKTDASTETFSVPTLSNFIKMNPGLHLNNAMAQIDYSHPVPEHSHNIQEITKSIIIENAISVVEAYEHGNINSVSSINNIDIPLLCPGYNPTNSTYYDFTSDDPQNYISPVGINLELSSNILLPNNTDLAGQTTEPVPIHNCIPFLIYIGRHLVDELN